jgi:hypothetical protein
MCGVVKICGVEKVCDVENMCGFIPLVQASRFENTLESVMPRNDFHNFLELSELLRWELDYTQ